MLTKKLIAVLMVIAVLLMVSAFGFDINNGDSIAIFNNLVVPEGTTVTGDAVAIFGKIDMRGNVRGDVVTVFGKVDVYGEAGGDVVAVFGNVNLKSTAVVNGDIAGVFGNVDRENGAIVRGEVIDTRPGSWHGNIHIVPGFGTDVASVVSLMIVYALSCLVLVLVPDRTAFMAQRMQYNIGRSFGIGILVLLGTMLLVPALIITIIGIIPAILLVFAFAIVAFVSMTALYVALGRKVAAAVEGKNAVYIHLLIGLVIVGALEMIPVVGFLVALAAFFVALGVAFDTRVGKPLMRKTM